jgi:putative transposase
MLRQDGSGQKISEFVELIKEWEMHFYVPNDSVRIICYEMGEDHTDSRMAGQITDRTHLAYAIAYGFKYFISTDTLIKSYQLPHALTKYGFRIMGRGAPLLFVGGGIGPPHITIHFHPAEIFFMPGECQPRRCMQSVTKLRLFASPDERRMLFATMERYNAACNAVSPVAFSERQFSNIGLQKRLYSHVRETFGLSAQMAQLAIRKVAGSYRSTKEAIKEQNKVLAALGKPLKTLTELSFREHGAIGYDARVLSLGQNRVSIWTLEGRIKLRYSKPAYFPAVTTVKQTDLVYRDGAFWLYATVETPDTEPAEPTEYLGVDLGVVNIATTSDGEAFSSAATEKVRQRYGRLRGALQKTGTRSAKRKLRKIAGREHRFKTDTNHVISKQIVCAAEGTKRGIALEDLNGILLRTTVRHDQRERHHKWAFHQLRSFIEYKAQRAGVTVQVIDGAYTSQQCSVCGFVHPDNRLTQAAFRCLACGHTENADLNASLETSLPGPPSTGLLRSAPPTPGERWNRKPTKSMVPPTASCPRLKSGVVD